ncbi:CpaF family protein, partial [candidate division CSSED10-310 bacterium]
RDCVFIEEKEKMTMVNREFASNSQLARVIQRIVRLGGARVGLDNPIAEVAIDDDIWVTAVLPPIAPLSPIITIQKSGSKEFSFDDLIDGQCMSRSIALFLRACIEGKRSIIVSGLTGSGRTTLLNTLIDSVPVDERIIVIEDRGELKLSHPNSCILRPRYSLKSGVDELSSKLMLLTALRMRPDRIILSDCRGDETFDFLQTMSSGHKGCLTTCHASSPADLISRLETLISLSKETLSPRAMKHLIFKSVDLIVHMEQMSDRSRKISRITELTGMEGEVITRSDIFHFRQLGTDDRGNIDGIFEPTGIVPSFYQELTQMGVEIPRDIF